MAPELFQKQGVYSYASDLWSLGCVLYEMATGKPPFSSSSLKELVSQIMDAPTPLVEDGSKEFNDLLTGLLEKDPVRRITWDLVRTHSFWEEPLQEQYLSPQPQFDSYMVARGLNPARYYEKMVSRRGATAASPSGKGHGENERKSEESGPTAATTGSKSEKRRDLDLLRLSQTVKKNILKEVEEYTQKEAEKVPDQNDIRLVSKDQELNFSEKPEEDEEKTLEKTPEAEEPEFVIRLALVVGRRLREKTWRPSQHSAAPKPPSAAPKDTVPSAPSRLPNSNSGKTTFSTRSRLVWPQLPSQFMRPR